MIVTNNAEIDNRVSTIKYNNKEFVEVVRCKDCIYRNKYGECENNIRGEYDRDGDYYIDPEFFCADGERKETDE